MVDRFSAIIREKMLGTSVFRMRVRTKTFSSLSRPDNIFSHETYGLIRGYATYERGRITYVDLLNDKTNYLGTDLVDHIS